MGLTTLAILLSREIIQFCCKAGAVAVFLSRVILQFGRLDRSHPMRGQSLIGEEPSRLLLTDSRSHLSPSATPQTTPYGARTSRHTQGRQESCDLQYLGYPHHRATVLCSIISSF